MNTLTDLQITAVTVAVDYPILHETVPYNIHHLARHIIITTPEDEDSHAVADKYGLELFVTKVFYEEGAYFNKYRAVEECFDHLGREGWILQLDADIFIPAIAQIEAQRGTLYTPYRRMANEFCPERDWIRLKRDPYQEFSGYFHLFHAEDIESPWFEKDWIHAGGADTMFQNRWTKKIRPDFDVLHVGPGRKNWCGVGNNIHLEQLMKKRNEIKSFDAEKTRVT